VVVGIITVGCLSWEWVCIDHCQQALHTYEVVSLPELVWALCGVVCLWGSTRNAFRPAHPTVQDYMAPEVLRCPTKETPDQFKREPGAAHYQMGADAVSAVSSL
jgi:hypothetical protein